MADNTFDPVAMGLYPQYVGRNMDINDAHDTAETGTQTGWSKSVGDGYTQQYDMTGKDMGITRDQTPWESIRPIAGIALAAFGGQFLSGMGAFGEAGMSAAGLEAAQSAALAGSGVEAGGIAATGATEGLIGAGSAATTAAPAATEAVTGTVGASTAAPAITEAAAPGAYTTAAADSVAANAGVYTGSVPAAVDLGSAGGIVSTGGGILSTMGDAAKTAMTWIKDNKELAVLLGSSLNGLFSGNALGQVAEINAQSQLDQINLKEKLRLEAQKRYSSSVGGLRIPGLINARAVDPASRIPAFAGLINAGR